MSIEVDLGDRKECSVCHEKKVGVQLKEGKYRDIDFVCEGCIDKYFHEVVERIYDKIGREDTVFNKLREKESTISHIDDIADNEWKSYTYLYDQLADIYATIFTNGITSGNRETVGKWEGRYRAKDVYVSGRGIGLRSRYRETCNYPSLSKQVKVASTLWRDIAERLSSVRDRKEKFTTLFKTFEEATEDIPNKDDQEDSYFQSWKIDISKNPIRYKGNHYTAKAVKNSSTGKTKLYCGGTRVPLEPPNNNLKEWAESLEQIENALERVETKTSSYKERLAEAVEKVEESVKDWYVANSLAL